MVNEVQEKGMESDSEEDGEEQKKQVKSKKKQESGIGGRLNDKVSTKLYQASKITKKQFKE